MRNGGRLLGGWTPPNIHRRLSDAQFSFFVSSLLASAIFLSLADLFSTITALRIGLEESNYALILASSATRMGILPTLTISKALFLTGCASACLIAVKSRGRSQGTLALFLVAGFVVLQLAVFVNNLALILG